MSKFAVPAEIFKILVGIVIFVRYGNWFEANGIFSILTILVPTYIFISFALTIYFLTNKPVEHEELRPQLIWSVFRFVLS